MSAAADEAAVGRRLEQLAARHALTRSQLGQLRCLLEIVATDPHVPTAITAPREAIDIHIADSLTALDLGAVRAAARIVDIGSGAGFPGLPLAVALPGAELHLLESSSRRCAFIERASSVAGVRNATAVASRVEAWDPEDREHDVVTARAVAPLAVLCEYAAPLLRLGGTLVVWRGRRDHAAEQAGRTAAVLLGLESRDPIRSEPYPGSQEHHLHVYVKVGATPARFPRRPGIASKRPLGVST